MMQFCSCSAKEIYDSFTSIWCICVLRIIETMDPSMQTFEQTQRPIKFHDCNLRCAFWCLLSAARWWWSSKTERINNLTQRLQCIMLLQICSAMWWRDWHAWTVPCWIICSGALALLSPAASSSPAATWSRLSSLNMSKTCKADSDAATPIASFPCRSSSFLPMWVIL